MKALRQFGVLVWLLASWLTPAMACMIPGAQMTTEERACCRMMQNQCEHMDMPASRGCCQKNPPNVYANAPDTSPGSLHPAAINVVWLAYPELLNPPSSVTGWVEQRNYSPPKSPPSAISILRI